MQGEAELRIPKIAVTVELVVENCKLTRVDVFVAEHTDHAYRRERLLDLLEDSSQFLPARDVAGDQWAAYNKETIVWLGLPLADGELPIEEAEESPMDELLFDVVRDVSVKLSSGETKRGQLMYSPAAGQSRVSDHLNGAGRFFRLWTVDHVFLINKRYVIHVVEHDAESKGAVS